MVKPLPGSMETGPGLIVIVTSFSLVVSFVISFVISLVAVETEGGVWAIMVSVSFSVVATGFGVGGGDTKGEFGLGGGAELSGREMGAAGDGMELIRELAIGAALLSCG